MHLNIGGITPFTSIDFPGCLAAVVFCQGCAWRCTYCHNPHLLFAGNKDSNDWETLKEFLQQRSGFLDGVVFSGGEPLLQSGLIDAIKKIKALGYKVALHTSGANPKRFEKSLPYLDWVGLDVKTCFDRYEDVTGIKQSGAKVKESLSALLKTDIDYEIRTTVDSHLLNEEVLLKLAKQLASRGVKRYVLQECRSNKTNSQSTSESDRIKNKHTLTEPTFLNDLKNLFPDFSIRLA